jgi:hypothetical protein
MSDGVVLASGVVARGPDLTQATGVLPIANGGTAGASAQVAAQGLSTGWVVAKSGVSTPSTNTTSEEVIVTITIPAGAMGPNGCLRLISSWSALNNANVKTVRWRLGGLAGTILETGVLTSRSGGTNTLLISNRNAQNSQISCGTGMDSSGTSFGVNPNIASAIDTSASTTLVLTSQKATGTDTQAVEQYIAEIFYGA